MVRSRGGSTARPRGQGLAHGAPHCGTEPSTTPQPHAWAGEGGEHGRGGRRERDPRLGRIGARTEPPLQAANSGAVPKQPCPQATPLSPPGWGSHPAPAPAQPQNSPAQTPLTAPSTTPDVPPWIPDPSGPFAQIPVTTSTAPPIPRSSLKHRPQNFPAQHRLEAEGPHSRPVLPPTDPSSITRAVTPAGVPSQPRRTHPCRGTHPDHGDTSLLGDSSATWTHPACRDPPQPRGSILPMGSIPAHGIRPAQGIHPCPGDPSLPMGSIPAHGAVPAGCSRGVHSPTRPQGLVPSPAAAANSVQLGKGWACVLNQGRRSKKSKTGAEKRSSEFQKQYLAGAVGG